jgi:hypothetical protein
LRSALLVSILVATLAAGASILAAGAVRFLSEGGVVFTWDGLSASLGHAAAVVVPAGGSVRVVLEAGPQTLVVLSVAPADASHGRHRHEGEARLYDPSISPPKLLRTIAFEGEPLEGLVSTNLRKAWVLAYRPPEATGGAPRTFLYALDLGSGRIEASSEPGAPVSGIALDAESGRVYASQKDRIQTFTQQPLVASWHLRSPGLNGPLALVPGTGILCVVRGSELAVFDPEIIDKRDAAARRTRADDASAVIHLPFQPDHLALSDDGHLALVSAPGTMVFVEPAAQAMIWPGDSIAGLKESAAVRALAFPGPGRDLIVALLPSGAVTAVRTPPPQPKRHLAPEPPISAAPDATTPGATGPGATVPQATFPAAPAPAAAPAPTPAAPPSTPPAAPAPQAAGPSAATSQPVTPSPAAPATAEPQSVTPHAVAPPPIAPPAADESPAAPVEAKPAAPTGLSGKLTGDVTRVHAIVLYGPNNILKEYARVRPEADGSWSAPLPPAGAYRMMAVGDGSTPLPVKPGYIALKVVEGVGQSGLDFEVKSSP